MAIKYNGAELTKVVYNGVDLDHVFFNNVLVFNKSGVPPVPPDYVLRDTYTSAYSTTERDLVQWGVSFRIWSDTTRRTFDNADGLGGAYELYQQGTGKNFLLKIKGFVLDGARYCTRSGRVVFSAKATFLAKLNSYNSGNTNFAITNRMPYVEPLDADWTTTDYTNFSDYTNPTQQTNLTGADVANCFEWGNVYKTILSVPNWGNTKTTDIQIFLTAR